MRDWRDRNVSKVKWDGRLMGFQSEFVRGALMGQVRARPRAQVSGLARSPYPGLHFYFPFCLFVLYLPLYFTYKVLHAAVPV